MKLNHFIGATLLVAGTAIGAGMLALPVSTAQYGFYPSALVFITCWFFMLFASLYLLEVNLWLPDETNIISMAQSTLGTLGAIVAWISYLLLLYTLLSAYTSGLGALFHDLISAVFHISLPVWISASSVIVIAGLFIYLGTSAVDSINRLFFIGLLGALGVLLFALMPHVKPAFLAHAQPQHIQLALPIIFTTFGFQVVVPTLRTYLQGHTVKLRYAIVLGSLLPLIVYLLWEMVILGTVPLSGENSVTTVLASAQPEVSLSDNLSQLFHAPWLGTGFRYFAAFAITTSFLGVSLSLFDFLGDGCHMNRHTHKGRLLTLLLTFIPPFLFASLYPSGFLLALEYAGLCVAVLFILLPALMVWNGRYRLKIAHGYRVSGGKIMVLLVVLFALSAIILDLIVR